MSKATHNNAKSEIRKTARYTEHSQQNITRPNINKVIKPLHKYVCQFSRANKWRGCRTGKGQGNRTQEVTHISEETLSINKMPY